MNKLVTLVTAFALIGLGSISFASKADSIGTSNIKFTVNIITWSCTISTASQNITVNLGTWDSGLFTAAGTTTTPASFSIALNNCNNASVTTSFAGIADQTNSSYLALNSASTAKNVAIELLNSDKSLLALNKESNAVTVNSSGNATMNFYANYVTTASSVQAGTADADATFTINYY